MEETPTKRHLSVSFKEQPRSALYNLINIHNSVWSDKIVLSRYITDRLQIGIFYVFRNQQFRRTEICFTAFAQSGMYPCLIDPVFHWSQ